MITETEENRYAELQQIALDAARNGDLDTLRPMIQAGLPVELKDDKGNSLLMLAAYHGNLQTVRMLVAEGANPDALNDRNQTPLAGVAFKGYLDIAKILVESGADPSADQGGGRTPVMFAAMFGHQAMVEYLESQTQVKITSRIWGIRVNTLARFVGGVRRLFSLKAA
ncbi:ankyrin repeat domain-containing protein [Coraliomargarita sp. SDUM461004]|uniref:Ankyrin repeat domain-containing protein n=1 Tax=Thalassobacterium sedimentorum TaxID=3041258 RepID=A0ABU1AKY8_9BACT|nr:ankyrin repeat domain-containing protein [Coraliomargarita sp. SDUM461004]MDQ8195476.1 ankyrin repeat domain-containing protein [Coraliomargarita sp. SDUM461004]